MSQDYLLGHRRLRWVAPMVGRDPNEQHRASTPLELFFDLVFVVAVATAADRLHHGLAEGEVASSLLSYALVFFGIYWAWVNFTWFASAYDSDDVVYRLFVFVTMAGALTFAAGIPIAFDERNFTIAVIGYAVMRAALVTQWLRVARDDAEHRRTGHRFAVGLTLLQLGWLAALLLPPSQWVLAFVVLAVGEVLLPVWGERAAQTRWHIGHISERYGLFMIIVLGESVLAASFAIQTSIAEGGLDIGLAPILVGGILIVFSIWWTYFERPPDSMLESLPTALVWSYLHVLVFAAVAAIGAGLAVAVEAVADRVVLEPRGVAATVAVPLAIYILSIWALYARPGDPPVRLIGVPVAVACIVAAIFTPAPILIMGCAVAGLVALKTALRLRGLRT